VVDCIVVDEDLVNAVLGSRWFEVMAGLAIGPRVVLLLALRGWHVWFVSGLESFYAEGIDWFGYRPIDALLLAVCQQL
jgi:hypothetical protein